MKLRIGDVEALQGLASGAKEPQSVNELVGSLDEELLTIIGQRLGTVTIANVADTSARDMNISCRPTFLHRAIDSPQ